MRPRTKPTSLSLTADLCAGLQLIADRKLSSRSQVARELLQVAIERETAEPRPSQPREGTAADR